MILSDCFFTVQDHFHGHRIRYTDCSRPGFDLLFIEGQWLDSITLVGERIRLKQKSSGAVSSQGDKGMAVLGRANRYTDRDSPKWFPGQLYMVKNYFFARLCARSYLLFSIT